MVYGSSYKKKFTAHELFFLMSLKSDSSVVLVDFSCLCNQLLYVSELVIQ